MFAELSPLRVAGLIAGLAILGLAVARRRTLSNGDVALVLLVGFALIVAALTPLVNGVLAFFSFREGGGGRVLGVVVFATIALFFIAFRALVENGRLSRRVADLIEGLAWHDFRGAGLAQHFGGKVAVVIPAYNEEGAIGAVIDRMPHELAGLQTAVLVVDDGSRDNTGAVARAHGAHVAYHASNRGQGAALRTGYRLVSYSEAKVLVTLDADGQHLPEEMESLVRPVLAGEVAVAHGSRVLGHAERGDLARELGAVFFNRLISVLAGQRLTDCSNGYRVIGAQVLPELVFRQEQFHSSEFLLEAIKRGFRVKEFPVTVRSRAAGETKKPASLRYGAGFANAIFRTWLRAGRLPSRPPDTGVLVAGGNVIEP